MSDAVACRSHRSPPCPRRRNLQRSRARRGSAPREHVGVGRLAVMTSCFAQAPRTSFVDYRLNWYCLNGTHLVSMRQEYGHPFGPQCVVSQTRTDVVRQVRPKPGMERGAGPTTIGARTIGTCWSGFPGSLWMRSAVTRWPPKPPPRASASVKKREDVARAATAVAAKKVVRVIEGSCGLARWVMRSMASDRPSRPERRQFRNYPVLTIVYSSFASIYKTGTGE